MTPQIDPATAIGVVALSVADLAGSLSYYQQRIGLRLLSRSADVATLGVGRRALLQLRATPGAVRVRRASGLYHFALRVPARRDLAAVLRHLADSGTPVDGAADHRFSEALYLSDPDGHGIEIYRDRPRDAWYDAAGRLHAASDRLDVQGIMRELGDGAAPWDGLPDGTDMGHIHLHVGDLAASDRFYTEVLGFARMLTMPSASFVGAGGYHHHIGMNTWAGVGVGAPPPGAARLLSYEIVLPSAGALASVRDRAAAAGAPLEEQADGWLLRDPAQISVLLRAAG